MLINNINDNNSLTLHVVLSTIPQEKGLHFKKSIQKGFYESFQDEIKDFSREIPDGYNYSKEDKEQLVNVLYSPLRYYMLGNYDVTYIALIDNFKFSQRLFEPDFKKEKDPIFLPHAFQSFTGVTSLERDELKTLFYQNLTNENINKKFYFSLSQIKLDNGLYIGNGEIYFNEIVSKINKKVHDLNSSKTSEKSINIIILNSFSWSEITLLIFNNDLIEVIDLITSLRKLTLEDLENCEEIAKRSLYNIEGDDKLIPNILKSKIFADTHTHFGIHADLIEFDTKHPFVEKFRIENKDQKLIKAEIEWQVKPGFMKDLMNYLKNLNNDHEFKFNMNKKYFLAGKTDYFLQEVEGNILTVFELLRHLKEPNCGVFKYVRKIKTRLLFERQKIGKKPKVSKLGKVEENENCLEIEAYLKDLIISNTEMGESNEFLKSMKISREIRLKIIKIFSNFNNGIIDPILFPFFLDFKIFIKQLVGMIREEHEAWSDSINSNVNGQPPYKIRDNGVNAIEKKLMNLSNIFQESYNVRMLNGYQFEDINDFDLDFNTSIQRLLTAYNTILIDVGNCFYTGPNACDFGPIMQINLKGTVGTYTSVNYFLSHLTSPEYVFATLTKEILNSDKYDNFEFKRMNETYNSIIENIRVDDPYLMDLINEQVINFKYLTNDCVRFLTTYNLDFELYNYWSWNCILQSASLFDISGMINEEYFRQEQFRILFVSVYFDKEIPRKSPIPEISTYWERHFSYNLKSVYLFLDILKKYEVASAMREYLNNRFYTYYNNISQDVNIPLKDDKWLSYKSDFVRQIIGKGKSKTLDCSGFANYNYLVNKINMEKLNQEPPSDPFILDKGSVFYLIYEMQDYLVSIAMLNKYKNNLVRRDWNSGRPLKSFVKWNTDNEFLYSVDQTGGLFFEDISKLNLYMSMSRSMLQIIIDYSQISKLRFVKLYYVKKNGIV